MDVHLFIQGKWDVPIPKVRGVSENEVFKVVKTGKTRSKYMYIFLSFNPFPNNKF